MGKMLGKILGTSDKHSIGYSIFVDSQMKLYQKDPYFRSIAERYGGDYKEIKEVSQRVVSLLTSDHLAKKSFDKPLDDYDRLFVSECVNDKSKWDEKAKGFGKIIAPYMEMLTQEEMDSLQNAFSQALKNDPAFKKQLIRIGLGKGKDDLSYANGFEIFDEAYKKNAEEIIIQSDAEGETPKLPIFHLSRKKLGENDSFSNVAWEKTFFVENGEEEEAWMSKKTVPFEIEEELSASNGSFRDIAFIVDVSGSMNWNGKPLDGSKYDLALRSVYGVINYLESLGKAKYMRFGALLFSSSSNWSGWKEYGELDAVKGLLFTGYQGGGTTLKRVDEITKENGDPFMALVTSDGDIENAEEAASQCKASMDSGNDFIVFQIQSNSSFASKLEEHGALVVSVAKPEDLVGLNIKAVKERYGPKG